MLSNMWLVTMLVLFQPLYIQGKINVFIEDIKIIFVNEEYFEETEVFLDDEDNGIFVDFDLLKPLSSESKGKFVLLGFSMGKYNAPSGIDLMMDLCEMVDEPILLGAVLLIFGFTSEKCPPQPGHYGTQDFHLPSENLPEDFIANKYLGIFEILDETDESLIKVEVYIDIH